MERDCTIFVQGRFVFPEFPCWDSDSEEKRFFESYRHEKVHDPHSYVMMRKDNPTLEELLPSDLAKKVSIYEFKKLVFQHFPSTSPLYQVLTQEKDELTPIELNLKWPIYENLARISKN